MMQRFCGLDDTQSNSVTVYFFGVITQQFMGETVGGTSIRKVKRRAEGGEVLQAKVSQRSAAIAEQRFKVRNECIRPTN